MGFSHRELDVEPGSTVADILDANAIDRARPMIIARNGWAVEPDERAGAGRQDPRLADLLGRLSTRRSRRAAHPAAR